MCRECVKFMSYVGCTITADVVERRRMISYTSSPLPPKIEEEVILVLSQTGKEVEFFKILLERDDNELTDLGSCVCASYHLIGSTALNSSSDRSSPRVVSS